MVIIFVTVQKLTIDTDYKVRTVRPTEMRRVEIFFSYLTCLYNTNHYRWSTLKSSTPVRAATLTAISALTAAGADL